MRQRYVDMLRQVNVAAHSIASASSQIAQGNVDLSERTENTAQSLARSAQSIEEVTHGVRQSADAARQAHQLSEGAVEVASRGGQVVSNVVATMGAINRQQPQDWRHHRRDRWDCVPDQDSGPERSGRSRPRG